MLKAWKQRRRDKTRIVYVRKSGWNADDQAATMRFIKSPTWERLVMRCQTMLLTRIFGGTADERYRSGYLDCINDIQSVRADEQEDAKDEEENYPIQGVDDE